MKNIKILLSLYLSLFLAGCTTVITKEPIGDVINIEKELLNEENSKHQVDGAWNGDTILFTKVLDDGKTIKFATILWDKEKNDFVIDSQEILLSKLNEKIYINQKAQNEYHIAAMGFALSESENNELMDILVFYPDGDLFKKAIKEKTLKGKIEKIKSGGTNIYIQSNSEELNSFIENNHGKLFDFETPSVYRKIKDIDWEK